MRTLVGIVVSIAFCCMCQRAQSQDTSSLYRKLYNLPDKLFGSIHSKSQRLQEKILHQTERYLTKLERQERKLQEKLAKKDSLAAEQVFGNIAERYAGLRSHLHGKSDSVYRNIGAYSGHADSVKTALNFIQQQQPFKLPSQMEGRIKSALGDYQSLQGQFEKVQDIKKILKERQIALQSQLEKFGMAKELTALKKQVYYYRAQMDEYRRMFDDPAKMEAKMLRLATKIPAFKDFFKEHSDLSSLFSVPEDYGSMNSLQGLQTRAEVQQLMQQGIASAGAGAQQQVQQNIQQAQTELTHLKNKLGQLGKESSDADVPDFKPNTQKTKSFFDRLEFGTNMQSSRSNAFFPSTTDLGLSVGYKLNDKSLIGIGGSYKIGLGKDWNHIAISHQGIGLRSFVDFKLKGTFWITGGGELNYRSQFHDLTIFENYRSWQQSALIGLTKKYKIGKKFKGNLQLLYDFLYSQQVPRTQPVIFRLGYTW